MKFKSKVNEFMHSYSSGTAAFYEGLHFLKVLLKNSQILSERNYVVNSDKRIVYLANCKVANSSIKATMFEYNCEDNYQIHKLLRQAGKTRKDKLKKEEKDYFKFTFVRNPYERLVSCYESKYHVDVSKHHKKIKYFDTYLFGYLKEDQGFDTFIYKITKIREKWLDAHFMLQYDLIYDKKNNKLVDYVGKFENLQQDFAWIQEKYNLKPLPHYNSSGVGESDKWMDYYTLETAELVHEKYKKDFETFGYEDYYTKLIHYLSEKKDAE